MTGPGHDQPTPPERTAPTPPERTARYTLGPGGLRTIARNTTVQIAGEGLSKLVSLGLYVVVARVGGPKEFGALVFALSLALLTTAVASFGVEGIIVREAARDRKRAARLLTDAITLRLGFGTFGLVVAILVAQIANYSTETRIAVGVLALSAVIDLISKCYFATFQALDDMRPIAACLLLQRSCSSVLGILLVLAGGSVATISLAFLAGSVLALLCGSVWLSRRGVSPDRRPSRAGSLSLAKASFALGVSQAFNTVLFRADATMLSLIKGNLAVGVYGVAYRLLESTLFITYNFVAALAPTLARLRRDTTPPVARALEFGCRALALVLVPIGDVLVAFPHAIVQALYGSSYGAAEGVMRLLGGAAVTYGFAYLASVTLVSQERDRVLPWTHLVVMIQNVALNFALIPSLSYTGAALSTTISETTRAVILMWYAIRATGPIRWVRITLAPVIGTAAVASVALTAGTGLVALVLAVLAYLAVAFVVERLAFPGDAELIATAIRHRPVAAGTHL